jgi:hypothetical protein
VRLTCVLALVGGLGVVAAYWMPWFGTQGILLSGAFLNEFLSTTPDLRRVMPGASGGPQEAQQLRGLVLFFPAAGAVGAVIALVAGLSSGRSRLWGMLLAVLGGVRLAGSYASVIAFATVALALRGRAGAAQFFPLRACLFAPLWVFERSVSVYWALYRRVRGADVQTAGVSEPAADTSSTLRASHPRG